MMHADGYIYNHCIPVTKLNSYIVKQLLLYKSYILHILVI